MTTPPAAEAHLSQFSTSWSALLAAHQGPADQQREARHRLLRVYERAVRGYLRAAVRDADAADELFNEFAVRLLRGDFRATDPDKGRFRSFLKTVLYHLVVDHRRRRARDRAADLSAVEEPPAPAGECEPDDDRQFLARWTDSLLETSRAALRDVEAVGGPPLAQVLALRTEHLGDTDDALAVRLAERLGRPVEPGTFRRWLHLARRQFTDALVAEVAWTLADPSPEALADELQILGLLDRCRPALARRSAVSARR
jgi:RNA polymerase sigma-70 factor (ECF subfamily)